MNKFLLTVCLLSSINAFTQTGKVGIGTTNPQAMLHVADSAVLFTGPLNLPGPTPYNPPASGPGSRMMWYPQKAAFRVGIVNDNSWDKDSIGRFSFATGFNTKALGDGSFASGNGAIARGINSISMGNNTNASGINATSLGYFTTANADFATSLGVNTNASGSGTTSLGVGTIASGYIATSIGNYTNAIGDYSTATGNHTIARSSNSFVIGKYNDSSNINRLFEIGNGIAENARSNALTVLTNGNAGFGTTAPQARLHVADSAVLFTGPLNLPGPTPYNPPASGPGSRMMWYPQKAAFRVGTVDDNSWDKDSIGIYSFATGFGTKAVGQNSFAVGGYSRASGYNSTSMGNTSNAEGDVSTSMGGATKATGYASTSMGYYTNATGDYSTSMGGATKATGYASTTMGSFT
ncbi:MAG: hypothetical protein ACOYLO_13745, partial [Ferruginibacter sp.]